MRLRQVYQMSRHHATAILRQSCPQTCGGIFVVDTGPCYPRGRGRLPCAKLRSCEGHGPGSGRWWTIAIAGCFLFHGRKHQRPDQPSVWRWHTGRKPHKQEGETFVLSAGSPDGSGSHSHWGELHGIRPSGTPAPLYYAALRAPPYTGFWPGNPFGPLPCSLLHTFPGRRDLTGLPQSSTDGFTA